MHTERDSRDHTNDIRGNEGSLAEMSIVVNIIPIQSEDSSRFFWKYKHVCDPVAVVFTVNIHYL